MVCRINQSTTADLYVAVGVGMELYIVLLGSGEIGGVCLRHARSRIVINILTWGRNF